MNSGRPNPAPNRAAASTRSRNVWLAPPSGRTAAPKMTMTTSGTAGSVADGLTFIATVSHAPSHWPSGGNHEGADPGGDPPIPGRGLLRPDPRDAAPGRRRPARQAGG